ncbi:MAG: CDP-alcohol phosphatidyltransferase family protein [Patescibacteria group bacterium]|jgi:phosphatidylglycerophosphate synthase
MQRKSEKPKIKDIIKIPNILTSIRIIIALTIIALFFTNNHIWLVKWLFVIGILTDTLDGNIARLFNQKSRLGVMLEPIADTLLVAGTVLFVTFRLDLPKLIFLIYVAVVFVGFLGIVFVYLIRREWFADKLVVSEIAIVFVYGTGIFYLFGLPYKNYLALFTIGFGIAALIDLIIKLKRFKGRAKFKLEKLQNSKDFKMLK